MDSNELEARWEPNMTEVRASMAEWRQEHPRATLSEIEDALDERLATLRTVMLVDTALASRAAAFAGKPKTARPKCPECEHALVSRGEAERRLQTTAGRELRLKRSYAHCPSCGLELFPPG